VTAIRLFVNEKAVDVTAPSTVADAVTAFDSDLGAALLAGTARATDARGIDIAASEPVGPGSILRVFKARPEHSEGSSSPQALKSLPDAHA
jgi:hypothetical protein